MGRLFLTKAIFLEMFKNEVYSKELEKAGIKLKTPFVYTDESSKGKACELEASK